MPDHSFDEFVRAALPTLRRYAYALTGAVGPGDDLIQDTLVKVAGAWRRVHGDGNPVAYAKTAMLNTYLSAWRTRRRRPELVPLVDDRPGPDAYAGVDARDLLRRALGRLPRDQRAVLVLGFLDDLSDDQLATLLNRRPATVRSLRARGLAALRQQLAPEGVGGETHARS
ncbi:DNA-directed RNA polymerase sigma-70 factor [Catellatospora sp. TT07R-123]|uniref:SigE family RNA polymerase sigma factor n=1 Tax=Catellatospora sp. TT07R-123 TaxID=2733863 RepID=UPI001B2DA332|nr:SigE family RNA polymerase sigma factor [Catellatospora sp. TT07R-123]GHJ47000.1 DNA-directed RNA polymerase sigma-70 factor [Catellatospora sp. TT07R-123]